MKESINELQKIMDEGISEKKKVSPQKWAGFVDKEKYWDNIKYLKEHFNEEIFTYKDVSDGRLYEKIIEILT